MLNLFNRRNVLWLKSMFTEKNITFEMFFFLMPELKPFSRALRFFSLKLNLNLV